MPTYRPRSTCRSMPDPSSVIAPREFMSLSRKPMASRACRSTPRIASTARPATSRTRPRTSTGSRPKAGEDPITRTCRLLSGIAAASLIIVATPAAARLKVEPGDPGLLYMQARAASMTGDHARSASLLSTLVQSQPGEVDLARKALSEAVSAGRMDLALELARQIPPAKLSSDGRLLLAADELRRNRPERALPWLSLTTESGALEFLTPLVTAWGAADHGDLTKALATIDQLSANSPLGPIRAEERALILLKFRRAAEAEPFVRQALSTAGGREARLRLAFADGYMAAGDQTRALATLEGLGTEVEAARRRVLAHKPSGQAIDNSAKAF